MAKVFAIDWFRGLAILFVVASHVPMHFLEGDTYWSGVFGELVENGTFFFVVISGFLFQWLIGRYRPKNYFLTKLKFVVFPYFLVLSCVLMGATALNSIGVIQYPDLVDWNVGFDSGSYFWHLLVGGAAVDALWYVPMAVLFFLGAPIFFRLQQMWWFAFIVVIAVFFTLTTFRPEANLNPLMSFVHYLGVYLLGMYMAINYQWLCKHRVSCFFVGLVGGGLCLFLYRMQVHSSYAWFYKGDFNFNLIEAQKMFITLFAFSIFSLLESRGLRLRLLEYLASVSFGVFFLHGIVIWALREMGFMSSSGPWMAYFTYFLAVLVISLLCVECVKKVFSSKSRLIIGC